MGRTSIKYPNCVSIFQHDHNIVYGQVARLPPKPSISGKIITRHLGTQWE